MKPTNIFFTADTHFGSQRTLELSRRPFSNVAEMDSCIIRRWNETVKPHDIVYHLGDFGDPVIGASLNGRIYMVPGNHDSALAELRRFCTVLRPVMNLHVLRLTLTHTPLLKEETKYFALFGHIHKLQMVKRNGLNVRVDCHNFRPISLSEVRFYQNAVLNHYDENVFTESVRVS